MNNFIQEGKSLAWLNDTGAAVESGALVIVGELAGVASFRISAGSPGTLKTEGVYGLPKVPGQAIGQGDRVFVEEGLVTLEPIAAGDETPNVPVGVAWAVAAAGSASVHVKINV
jgi:predicted RecA/RadA family phage recombinase